MFLGGIGSLFAMNPEKSSRLSQIPKDIQDIIAKHTKANELTQMVESSATIEEAFSKIAPYYDEYLGVLAQAFKKKFSKKMLNQSLLAADSDLNKIKMLVLAGADVNTKDPYGNFPLLNAAGGGDEGPNQSTVGTYESIVQFLIANGADVNAHDKDGRTALLLASNMGYDKIVALLLAARANPNPVSTIQDSPLHGAVWNGNTAVVKLLVDAGADVNAQNPHHESVLTMAQRAVAVGTGKQEIVDYLITKGAR